MKQSDDFANQLVLRLEIFERLDAYLAQAASAAQLGYVSEMQAVAFDVTRDLYSCDALYWSDGDHWSPQGEQSFGARLTPALEAVLLGPDKTGD